MEKNIRFRAVCLDLDGTLLNSNHEVSAENARAVEAASRAGAAIALVTGRGPTMYCPTARELGVSHGLYMVGFNGAVVYKMDVDGRPTRRLFETKMTPSQVAKVLTLADGLAVEYDVCDIQYARSYPGEPAELLKRHCDLVRSSPKVASELPTIEHGVCEPNKITILTTDPEGVVARAKATHGFTDDGIGLVVGGPFWVETVNLAADKAVGVKLVCDELGCTSIDCVYFGDGANDATSLAVCGLGVAMRQAKPEAKSQADLVSHWTNDENAVARELHKIFGT